MNKNRELLILSLSILFIGISGCILLVFRLYDIGEYSLLITMNSFISLFFIVPLYYVFRKDVIFGLFFLFLFIYTIFTQIAYLNFPYQLAGMFAGKTYNILVYIKYLIFIVLSFIGLFICFQFSYKTDDNQKFIFINKSIDVPKNLFAIYIIIHLAIMALFLSQHYHIITYYKQSLLKDNKIYMLLFYMQQYVILAIVFKIRAYCRSNIERIIYAILLIASLIIFILISMKAGQRHEVFTLTIGLVIYLYLSSDHKGLRNKVRVILFLAPLLLLSIGYMNAIRALRGSEGILAMDLIHLSDQSDIKYFDFNLKRLIFQDWCGVSVTLMESIKTQLVIPWEVIKSNIINSIPATISYRSLGGIISDMINKKGVWTGWGYYFFTEGYNMMGWYGIFYNSIIPIFGFKLWNRFRLSSDIKLEHYMTAVLSMSMINIVRAQSSHFIKEIFYAFIPSLFFYCLITQTLIKIQFSKGSKTGD